MDDPGDDPREFHHVEADFGDAALGPLGLLGVEPAYQVITER